MREPAEQTRGPANARRHCDLFPGRKLEAWIGNDHLTLYAQSNPQRQPPDGTRSPVATEPSQFSPALAAGVLLAACTHISEIFAICLRCCKPLIAIPRAFGVEENIRRAKAIFGIVSTSSQKASCQLMTCGDVKRHFQYGACNSLPACVGSQHQPTLNLTRINGLLRL
jgi:hypothetical protein